jgi:hypothetical protein
MLIIHVSGVNDMDILIAEKVAEVAVDNSSARCRLCGQRLEHVAAMVDSATGHLVQMFKCECGERTWDE